MSQSDFRSLSVADLVKRFAEIGIEDDNAEKVNDIPKRNNLRAKIFAIEVELKNRAGDQRSVLLALYKHPNMQVRLLAAKATLGVAPQEARQLIEWIAASSWPPQCGDAGMCLWALDEGIFKPK
jgi:uncharacterized protein DUF2019